MADLIELRRRGGADPLGGRIGRGEMGMFGFEGSQAVEQGVVLGVGDLWIVEDMVAAQVVVDGPAELLYLPLHVGRGCHATSA